jgi:hypothetical protein
MKPEEKLHSTVAQPTGVQRDSETPVPKKPSVLFIVSTSIGVLTILLLVFNAYHSIVD